jgi:hypothetical protein
LRSLGRSFRPRFSLCAVNKGWGSAGSSALFVTLAGLSKKGSKVEARSGAVQEGGMAEFRGRDLHLVKKALAIAVLVIE